MTSSNEEELINLNINFHPSVTISGFYSTILAKAIADCQGRRLLDRNYRSFHIETTREFSKARSCLRVFSSSSTVPIISTSHGPGSPRMPQVQVLSLIREREPRKAGRRGEKEGKQEESISGGRITIMSGFAQRDNNAARIMRYVGEYSLPMYRIMIHEWI